MATKTESFSDTLIRLGACEEARAWAKGKSLDRAWRECKRADWMLWLLHRTCTSDDDQRYRLMACDFAEAVLYLVHEGDGRPRRAIEAARAYVSGTISHENMAAARDAAWAAARDAAWAAARDAAWAAAWAAAGAAARDAARDAARAAAWAAARANAWDAARAAQCKIIRTHFPSCPAIRE